jgi:hypothetical protein
MQLYIRCGQSAGKKNGRADSAGKRTAGGKDGWQLFGGQFKAGSFTASSTWQAQHRGSLAQHKGSHWLGSSIAVGSHLQCGLQCGIATVGRRSIGSMLHGCKQAA